VVQEQKRYMLTGLLGTLAFHLVLLIAFLTLKIGQVKTRHQEIITIEFSEEEYKPIEEIIEESNPDQEEITPLTQEAMSNIVSNVADQVNEEISTEKYIQELMDEMGIEDLNPQHDNSLPDDPVVAEEQEVKEDVKTNFGNTRIEYEVPVNRKASYVDRPIYRCQGGGEVVVAIKVSPSGEVLSAAVKSATTSETCILETAIASARNFRFERDITAAKRVEGFIKYIFVPQ
jgi:outer membrane biosynthesis protein TonB